MELTSNGRLRLASFLVFGVLAAAGLGYGCSDDETTAPTTPKADASTGSDTGTGTDSGKPDTSTTTDSSVPDTSTTETGTDSGAAIAIANLATTTDGGITGTATFVQTGASVTVTINVTGATEGQHGVHIHANPACGDSNDAGPGTAAGGHWNPADASHGLPTESPHHLGDMGNITVTDGGTGTLSLTSTEWVVAPSSATNSVVNKAVIFHALVDQGAANQPVGGAGGRQACGIINLQ